MKGWGKTLAIAAVTIGAVASMGAVSATVGSQGDPLITLSYLNDKFTPEVLGKIDTVVSQQQATLKSQLDAQIQAFEEKLQGGAQGGTSAIYAVVSVPNGKRLEGGIGCEVMLRVGSAVCVSDSEPGLIDVTDGSTLSSGKSLVKNHLYMMTIEGRSVKAAADVKLLVRGTYSIK